MIKVQHPKLTVTLFKLVQHDGEIAAPYRGSDSIFDITPLLGDAGSVQVSKDIHSPCGGFSIKFADRVGGSRSDTVAAMIEPMDMIEIRASRQAWKYAGRKLPLIMRGFVTTIRRSESMHGGDPTRTVIITGYDSGVLWLINRFDMQLAMMLETPLIAQVCKLQAAVGMDAKIFPVSEFVKEVTDKITNEKVSQLNAISSHEFKPFAVDATVTEGNVSPFSVGQFTGPYWDLIATYADRPWNELFIEDRGEPGSEIPTVVFRPSHFKAVDGSTIMPGATDPGRFEVDDKDIIDLNTSRSSSRVANIFFVPPGASMIATNQAYTISQMANGKAVDFDHGNNSPWLFGIARMDSTTMLIHTGLDELPAKLPPGEREPANQQYVEWGEHRRDQLKALNRDNIVWEEGDAVVKGSETIKPGRWMTIHRGTTEAEYYCNRVAHNFSPLRDWTASVGLVRGTGFMVRRKQDGVYFKEGRRGPYSA